MTVYATFRTFVRSAMPAVAAVCVCAGVWGQSAPRSSPPPAPVERRAPSPSAAPAVSANVPTRPNQKTAPIPKLANGQHLAGWFDQHSNQTQAQRLAALEKEPGFHDLPAATQQRMRDRLTQLDNMPPEKREKVISRNEVMEKLTPEQRGQVRSAMAQWASLPPASHRAVARTFRVVRGMPPGQRLAYLNSPDIRSQFTEQERSTLSSLMAVERYLPAGASEPPPQQ